MNLLFRALAELMVAMIPPIFEKIVAACHDKHSPEQVHVQDSEGWDEEAGDYIDAMWPDNQIPGLAIAKMDAELTGPHPTREMYAKCKNTCVKLLQHFSMEPRRREQLQQIKTDIAGYKIKMATDIDMSLFSTCALWEGKIALYR